MTSAKEKVQEILAGTIGVTPGPWKIYDGSSWRRIGTTGRDYDDCAVLYPVKASDGHPDLSSGRGQDREANLEHIARLDPQTVATLCDDWLRMREALEQIAAFNDDLANPRLARDGSFSSFDEPGSVEIARAALS